jgi:hypothetical protein
MKTMWPVAGLLAFVLAGLACAADPTGIALVVSVDQSVPTCSLLDVTIDGDSSGLPSTGHFRSVYYDTDAGPAPFYFPTTLMVTVPSSVSGTVAVTVTGLDWMDGHAIARGTGVANVSPRHTTQAAVTLTAVTAPPGDGGVPDSDADAATDLAMDLAMDSADDDASADGGALADGATNAEAGDGSDDAGAPDDGGAADGGAPDGGV